MTLLVLRLARIRARWVAFAAFASVLPPACWVALAFPVTACSTCDRGGQAPIEYTQGVQRAGSYETSPPGGTWLHFPPGRRYRFAHGLGTDRLAVHAWLSVSEHPVPEGGTEEVLGNYAAAAGNAVVVERTDAEYVQVRSDTCAEYYLRVAVTRLD